MAKNAEITKDDRRRKMTSDGSDIEFDKSKFQKNPGFHPAKKQKKAKLSG